MSRRRVNIALGAIVALGVVLRVLAWRYEPPTIPTNSSSTSNPPGAV